MLGLADPVGLGVNRFEGQSVSWGVGVWVDGSSGRVERAVEEHRLDADVVVEPLQVAQVRGGRGDVGVQVRAAVARYLQAEG